MPHPFRPSPCNLSHSSDCSILLGREISRSAGVNTSWSEWPPCTKILWIFSFKWGGIKCWISGRIPSHCATVMVVSIGKLSSQKRQVPLPISQRDRASKVGCWAAIEFHMGELLVQSHNSSLWKYFARALHNHPHKFCIERHADLVQATKPQTAFFNWSAYRGPTNPMVLDLPLTFHNKIRH